jgi:hypothetical protein
LVRLTVLRVAFGAFLLNTLGSIAFSTSSIGAFIVPSTGEAAIVRLDTPLAVLGPTPYPSD